MRIFKNGRGIPAQSPIPPGHLRLRRGLPEPVPRRSTSSARAALLARGRLSGRHRPDDAAGRCASPSTPATPSARGRLRYQFFVDAWRRLGLDVEIAATNYNQFQDKVRRGAYQIFMWGWVADYPDPENFLFLLWGPMARSKPAGRTPPTSPTRASTRCSSRCATARTAPERLRADPRDARDPRARAAVDRALPPRVVRARPRLGAQREAARHVASRRSSTSTSTRRCARERRASGTGRSCWPAWRARGASRSPSSAPGRRRPCLRERAADARLPRAPARSTASSPCSACCSSSSCSSSSYASPTTSRAGRSARRRRPRRIAQWIANHGYDKPRFWNPDAPADTHARRPLPAHADVRLRAQRRRRRADRAAAARGRRAEPRRSRVPLFAARAAARRSALALFVAFFRETYIDRIGVVLCVLAMSVSMLLYIIGGQYLLGKLLRWFPISGFDPRPAVIAALPRAAGLVGVMRRARRATCASTAPCSSRRRAATTCARRARRAAATGA